MSTIPADGGTAHVDRDAIAPPRAGAGSPPRTLFPEDDGDRRRWRVRPAELARMLGTSKQSISRAIRDGKILLGPDGKVNPETATAQYLRHSDPTRLRARLLAPLVRDLQAARVREAALRAELVKLRAELAECEENLDFEATSAAELCAIGDALALAVRDLWYDLAELAPDARGQFLEGLHSRFAEQWPLLEGMDPEGRAAELAAQLPRHEGSPADAKDFLASMEALGARTPQAEGVREPLDQPIRDEDDDLGQ